MHVLLIGPLSLRFHKRFVIIPCKVYVSKRGEGRGRGME